MPQTPMWNREQQFWVGLRSCRDQYISVNVIWYLLLHLSQETYTISEQAKHKFWYWRAFMLWKRENSSWDSVFCGAEEIGKEDRREGRNLQTQKASDTTASLAALPHSPIYPGGSHHILTPLLLKARCWIGFLVSYSSCWIQDRKSLPSWTGAYGYFLATHYQVTIIHLVQISWAGKSSGSN